MMGFDRIEAVSLTDQFVQKIEAMIISGELVPGDQLPPAREMSARMGVSRPVISAGLVELEKMGFVEIVTRQGVYVSDYRKSGSLDTLTALLNYNGGVMRDDEVRSLLEVRGANECLCVKLVVERATQEELDGLAPLLDAIKSGRTDEERAEATFQFHHALSVLSRNAFCRCCITLSIPTGCISGVCTVGATAATACTRISSSSTVRCLTGMRSARRRSPLICSTASRTERSRSTAMRSSSDWDHQSEKPPAV
ncbi:MAG: FadR/GntR family transcriptional regulator [Oscillospiraceae bacterium]